MIVPGNKDIVLGQVEGAFPGFGAFKLTPAEQQYHATLWGTSGSGKSRLIEAIWLQLFNKGQTVGLIEPHHDLSFATLSYLVKHGFFRQHPDPYHKLVYVDWGSGAYTPFNVLTGDKEAHSIALDGLEAMLRVWPELTEAPLFQQLFLSSMIVLQANVLPITYLDAVLTDQSFRRKALELVSDQLIHRTFANFEALGRDQAQAAGSTLRRAFALSFSPLARRCLGQPENVLPFRRWMDSGTSFIMNLGNIADQQTRFLIGALLMVAIEQAALSRTDLLPSQRKPLTLLVDEWPAFAAQEKTISHVLSQARKFGLRLYLAGQSTSQVSGERLAGALENCKLTIAFGLGRDSAVNQSRHLASVDPYSVKEEARTEVSHTQYLGIAEQFEAFTQELQNLDPRSAYVKVANRPAVKIKTIGMPDVEPDAEELADVLAAYRGIYQRSEAEAEQAIASLSERVPPIRDGATAVTSPPAYARPWQKLRENDS